MTTCPCCGFKSESIISEAPGHACASCGAQPVGEALPRPERELPSFGRSLILVVAGTLLVLLFVAQTVSSFTQKLPTEKTTKEAFYAAGAVAFDYLRWFTAAQTAAWQLKWLMIPVTLAVLFGARKLYRSIVASPERFCGRRAALRGYIAAAAVPLAVLILIGITVPERLHQRDLGIEAGNRAIGYRFARAQVDYLKEFETLPSQISDLKRLPDPDGSLAAALAALGESEYKPSADLAVAPVKKPRPLRGSVILNASSDASDDVPTERISFTNYELKMPGPDKVFGTEDDLIMRDGYFDTTNPPGTSRRAGSTTGATKTTKR